MANLKVKPSKHKVQFSNYIEYQILFYWKL